MAERPWIQPGELRAHTQIKALQNLDDAQLSTYIANAEDYVTGFCNNGFEDNLQYPEIPDSVRRATLSVAQVYATNDIYAAENGGMFKSEHLGNYTYTIADASTRIDNALIRPLLEPYIIDREYMGVDLAMLSV